MNNIKSELSLYSSEPFSKFFQPRIESDFKLLSVKCIGADYGTRPIVSEDGTITLVELKDLKIRVCHGIDTRGTPEAFWTFDTTLKMYWEPYPISSLEFFVQFWDANNIPLFTSKGFGFPRIVWNCTYPEARATIDGSLPPEKFEFIAGGGWRRVRQTTHRKC